MSLARIGFSADPDPGRGERNGRSERRKTVRARDAGVVPGYTIRGCTGQRVSDSGMLLPAVVELVESLILIFTDAIAARVHGPGPIVGGEHAVWIYGRYYSGSDAPGSDELE